MDWIEQFKIALIEEDEERLNALIGSMPRFEDLETLVQVQRLVAQALELFEQRKKEIAGRMREIELSRKFLVSSDELRDDRNLDITS